VTVLDAFCDADTRAVASCITVPMKARGLDPEHLRGETGRLAVLGGGLGLVYGAGLEHTPDTLAWMAERFRLIGNPPRVLELLANPGGFFALLDRLDIPYPETRSEPPAPGTGGQWLVKEAGTSGGLGVRRWHDGDPRPIGTHYFQQFIDGPVLSVLFIANGADCTLIGTNRLRTAPLDGVSSFRYGGAVTRAVSNAGQRAQIERQCRVLVRALGLRGVNNLDYVLQGAEMRLLELNPRPSATLGLSEADCPGGWMRRHVRACLGELPEGLPDSGTGVGRGVSGHRIVYAPRLIEIPPHLVWPPWCHDRPVAGASIAPGVPLCTVSASGSDGAQTERRLLDRERRVLGLVEVGCPRDAQGPSR
jgi:predicted ATP-grasp superfamily ATP-dependent carboligase